MYKPSRHTNTAAPPTERPVVVAALEPDGSDVGATVTGTGGAYVGTMGGVGAAVGAHAGPHVAP